MRIRRRLFLSVVFLAASCLALMSYAFRPAVAPDAATAPTDIQCKPDANPGTFSFDLEGFSAWFPCPPVHLATTASTPFGQIDIITYEAEKDGVNYAVAYVDYAHLIPAGVIGVARGIILDGAQRAALRGQPVENPVVTDITLGDNPGQSISAQGKEKKLRARNYMIHSATYQVAALAPLALTDESLIYQFLDSFRPTR